MTPNQLIEQLKNLPSEVMDRPIMDDDDTIAPGWSLAPADICIGTGEFLLYQLVYLTLLVTVLPRERSIALK